MLSFSILGVLSPDELTYFWYDDNSLWLEEFVLWRIDFCWCTDEALDSRTPPCCVSWCLLKSTLRWKERQQLTQEKGLKPLCFRLCVIKLEDWVKAFPQMRHLYGRSPKKNENIFLTIHFRITRKSWRHVSYRHSTVCNMHNFTIYLLVAFPTGNTFLCGWIKETCFQYFLVVLKRMLQNH